MNKSGNSNLIDRSVNPLKGAVFSRLLFLPVTKSGGLMERWKAIEGYPKYEISNHGRIKSLHWFGTVNIKKKLLKIFPNNQGYSFINLHNGKQKSFAVHKLVMKHFGPPQPSPLHNVCHGDNNPMNPHIDNLRWATQKENMADKKKHGTYQIGENGAWNRLSNKDVAFIRILFKETKYNIKIAELFGIDRTTISKIRCGHNWQYIDTKHLEDELKNTHPATISHLTSEVRRHANARYSR